MQSRFRQFIATSVVALVACAYTAPVFAQHGHSDVIVGRDSANKIQIEADLDEPFGMEMIPGGQLISGFSTDDPGFFVLEDDEPGEDFFSFVGDGPQIRLHIDSLSGDLVVRDPEGGLGDVGPFFQFGNDFHKHLLFHSEGAQPGDTFSATFHLSDTSGALTDSDPFTIRFFAVPEPGTLALAAGGVVFVLMRRQRQRAVRA